MTLFLKSSYKDKFSDNFYTLWHIYYSFDDDCGEDFPLGMPWLFKGLFPNSRNALNDSEEYFMSNLNLIEIYGGSNERTSH